MRVLSLPAAVALALAASACGGDDRSPAAKVTTTTAPKAAGLERVTGTYRTTLTRDDVPEDAELAPRMVAGSWTVTISPEGGVNNGPGIQLKHAKHGVYPTPGRPEVRGDRLVNQQQHCWNGSFSDEVYAIRATGDELVLGEAENPCRPSEINAVLSSHPLKRIK